jgi:hypothetical protein
MSDQKPEDDGSAVKPQVIDLVAEEVVSADGASPSGTGAGDPAAATPGANAEAPSAPPPPPAPPPRKSSWRGTLAWIVVALVLGAAGGGWLYRDQLSSYFPTNEMQALRVRIDALESARSALGGQIDAVSRTADAAAQAAAHATAAAEASARSASETAATMSTRLDGLEQRIAAAEAVAKQAADDLDAFRKSLASAGIGTATGATDSAALAALAQRIDALEKDVASLKSSAGGGDTAALTAALSQALADLKAKIAAGVAYAAEYDRIARMVPAAAGLDVLAAHARDGLPGAPGLARELRDAIPSLPRPETPPAETGGYWSGLLDSLSGIVSIRTIGESDWPAVAEKAVAVAETGDLAQAIAVIDAAEGEKPVPLSQWRDRAAARLDLEAALAQASEAVLRQIAAMGATP